MKITKYIEEIEYEKMVDECQELFEELWYNDLEISRTRIIVGVNFYRLYTQITKRLNNKTYKHFKSLLNMIEKLDIEFILEDNFR